MGWNKAGVTPVCAAYPELSRRAFLPAFASMLVGGVALTALPRRAHAEQCGSSNVVCNPPTPVCCYATGRGYYCASQAMYC